MIPHLPSAEIIAWLGTYLVHSTLLLTSTLIVERFTRRERVRAIMWKVALVGAVATTSLQSVVPTSGTIARFRPATPIVTAAHAVPGTALSAVGVQPASPDRLIVHGADVASPPFANSTGTSDIAAAAKADPVLNEPTVPSDRLTSSVITPQLIRIVVILWAVVAVARLIILVLRHRFFRERLSARSEVFDAHLNREIGRLAGVAAVAHRIRLSASSAYDVPVLLNNREIVLPERFLNELNTEEQSAALAHEVAHIANRDSRWLKISAVMEAVLFFQPLHFVASRKLRKVSEFLADEWATQQSESQIVLAKCLMHIAEWITDGRASVAPAGVLAIVEQNSPLTRRVERLLASHPPERSPSRIHAALGIALMLGIVAWSAPRIDCDCDPVAPVLDTETAQAAAQFSQSGSGASAPLPAASIANATNVAHAEEQTAQTQAPRNAVEVMRIVSDPSTPGGRLTKVQDLAVNDAGLIFTQHSSDQRIRVFSPEGKLLQAFGRVFPADGTIDGAYDLLGARGDTILVRDQNAWSVSLLLSSGRLVRSWTPQRQDTPLALLGTDRELIKVRYYAPRVPGVRLTLDSMLYVVADSAGTVLSRVLRESDRGQMEFVVKLPSNCGADACVYIFGQPFAPRTIDVEDPSARYGFIVLPHTDWGGQPGQIKLFTVAEGGVESERVITLAARTMTSADADQWIREWSVKLEKYASNGGMALTEVEKQFRDQLRTAEYLPSADEVRIGSDRSIWIRPSWSKTDWSVVLAGDTPAYTVRVPDGATVLHVTAETFWAAQQDSAGMNALVKYRVVR